MKATGLVFLFCATAFPVSADPITCPIGEPFTVGPTKADGKGNSAAGAGGCLPNTVATFPVQIYLGTNVLAGTLVLDFPQFTDGPGDDFALMTGSYWGTDATAALVQFLNGESLELGIVATLAPDRLFTFDLPPATLVDRVWITNISPDPPGVNDNAAMSFLDAAVNAAAVTQVPEAGTLWLLGSGLAVLAWRRVRSRR